MSESDWELLDDGSWNGVRKWLRSTGDDHGSVEVRYEGFDAQPIVEANKRAQNEGFDRRADLWHAASIPTSVMYKWLVDHGVNAWNPAHMDAVKKLLNSSEYNYLKRAPIVI